MLLRNHGTLALGGRFILFSAALLPRTRMQNPARHYERHPNMPNQQAIDMMQQTFNNKDSWEGLGGVAWPSMRRLADRLDPSYQY